MRMGPWAFAAGAWRLSASALGIVVLLMGCASAPDVVIDTGDLKFVSDSGGSEAWPLLQTGSRVQRIAYRLKLGAVAWCGPHVHHDTGLTYWNAATEARLKAAPAAPSDGRPAVLYVATGSAADRAGVTTGDVFATIDGRVVATADEGAAQIAAWRRALHSSGQTTALALRRGQDTRDITLSPDLVCDFSVALEHSKFEYAGTLSSRGVLLSDRLVDALDDRALAFTIAHVAAHGLLGHVDQHHRTGNVAATADIPFFVTGFALAIASMGAYPQAAAMPFTTINDARLRRDLEPKADLWAVGMIAAAGFPVDSGDGLPLYDDLIHFGKPAREAQERRARLADAAAAFEAAQKGGQPLVPESPALKQLMVRASAPAGASAQPSK